MPAEFNSELLNSLWAKYFSEVCGNDLLSIANASTEKKSLEVDFSTIETFDSDFAYYLIERPIVALYYAEMALCAGLKVLEPRIKGGYTVRIKNLPGKPLAKVDVRGLRTRHLGKFVAVQGIVRKMTQVKSKLLDAAFKCARCGAIIREPQPSWDFKEPLECYQDQGGCSKSASSTRFILLTEETATIKDPGTMPSASVSIDSQKIEIQESPEALKGRDQPERLVAYLEADLCNMVYPGDKVTLNGVLRSSQRKNGNQKTNFFDWYLDVNSIEIEEHEFDEFEITPDEETQLLMMSTDENIQDKITASIAPTIYGMDHEKEALALQLFGGIPKTLPDNARVRGDIHILLVGDPGLAKSQLVRYISKLLPRGVFASGKATTGAGLTAAAVHDEFGEGRWTLEAGAMVLADKGGVCIDELDKMSPQDSSSMHEAMEAQQISVNKAGINATFQCRCSVLAAANPKDGRFNETGYLVDQITLSPALLSRFDAIFPIVDKINKTRDDAIASHILKVHLAGELTHYRQNSDGNIYTKEDEENALRSIEPIYAVETLRKYIAYARRNSCPVMTPETSDMIKNYYVELRGAARQNGEGTCAVPMTPRQIEAIIRMSEASARMRLSNQVLPMDAQRAINVMEYYLKKVASEGGILDIDSIMTGTSHARLQHRNNIICAIEELDEGQGVSSEELLRRVKSDGYDESKLDIELKNMMGDGILWVPTGDGSDVRYKVMRRGPT